MHFSLILRLSYYLCADGQKVAIRLTSRLKKVVKKMRDRVSTYNKQLFNPTPVLFESVTDPNCAFYSTCRSKGTVVGKN